jgi:hypothetical protein
VLLPSAPRCFLLSLPGLGQLAARRSCCCCWHDDAWRRQPGSTRSKDKGNFFCCLPICHRHGRRVSSCSPAYNPSFLTYFLTRTCFSLTTNQLTVFSAGLSALAERGLYITL